MKKRMLTAAVMAALAVPSFAMAEEAAPNTGAIKFSIGADYVTGYYFRGALQDNGSLIIQPYLGATFNAVSSDDVNVDLSLSTWNSMTSGREEGAVSWDNVWYESDLVANAAVTAFGFKFNAIYTAYFYPSDAFESIQEIGFVAGIDEKKFLGDSLGGFTINPYIGWYFEIADGNGEENQYIELGFNPSYTLDMKDVPYVGNASISFPIVIGLTMDHYFTDDSGDNEFFGYVSVGAATSIPLPMPAKYGAWNLNGSLSYLYLNADSLEAANNDSKNAFVGKLGVSIAY
jgi:hypothetical protein